MLGTFFEGILVVGSVVAAGAIGYYYGWDKSIFESMDSYREPVRVMEVVVAPKKEWKNNELIRGSLGVDWKCGMPEILGEIRRCEKQPISKLLSINFIGKPKKSGEGDMVFRWDGIESFSLDIEKVEDGEEYPLGLKFTFSADEVSKDNAGFVFQKVKEKRVEEIFSLRKNTKPEYRIRDVGWGLMLEKVGEIIVPEEVIEEVEDVVVEENIVPVEQDIKEEKEEKEEVKVEEKKEVPVEVPKEKEEKSWFGVYWDKFIASYSF